MAKRQCAGTNKAGKPCGANPLANTNLCIAHTDRETQERVGFGGSQEGAGRPKTPRITDVYAEELHRRVGERVEELIGRLVSIAMDAERTMVVGTGPNARTEIAPDQALQLAAIRELNDRILGRPKQQTELTGANGDAVVIALPSEAQWHADVARVLAEVGAFQANGNGNGNGHHPVTNGNGNGHGPDQG